VTGAGIALDLLEAHLAARKGAERPAGLRRDRYVWVLGIHGRVELENQFVIMIWVLGHLARAMNQRGGHDESGTVRFQGVATPLI
jgi:hypothetical protein